jgi:hypothetical protein
VVRPERRTRADIIAAAAIAAIVAVAAGVIWWTSDARATENRPAVVAAKPFPAAPAVPDKLRELWIAASPRTTMPIAVGGAVVTARDRTVTGHDPVSGAALWTFARDRELCGVSWLYQYAVAVYPDSRGCGQVSTVDGATGRRGPARTGYADNRVALSSDGNTVLATGRSRLELWRSDMVRVIGYGEVDARVKPGQTGIGRGCDIRSAAGASSAVSVLQLCSGHADLQLTLLRAGDQDDEPELRDVPLPGVGPDSAARVLAVADTSTAVYLPVPQPRVVVFDETGAEQSSANLANTPTPPGLESGAVSQAGGLITWWTGSEVIVFDTNRLAYRYTIPTSGTAAPLGPATMMANRLLIPVTGGVGVYEPSAGTIDHVIPLDRPPTPVPIVPGVAGTTVLEQRGDDVVALG